MLRPLRLILFFSLALSNTAAYGQDDVPTEEHYRQVVRLISAKRYDDSLATARHLIQLTEEHERVYYRVIQAARMKGNLEVAKEFFESLLPANPRGYYGLGLYFERKGNYAAAIENFRKCLDQLPDYHFPILPLISDSDKIDKLDEVEAYIRAMLATNPNSATAHMGMGYCLLYRKQLDEAAREMGIAQALDPQMANACYYKVEAFSRADRNREAMAFLNKCLPPLEAGLNDEYQISFRQLRGSIHVALGNYPEAVNDIEAALQIAQKMDDRSALEIASSSLGSLHIRHDNFRQAMPAFRQALEIAQQDNRPFNLANHLNGIADVYLALGDMPQTITYYEQAISRAEGLNVKLNTLSRLGRLFAANQDSHQASEYFKRLIELAGPSPTSKILVYEAKAYIDANDGHYFPAVKSLTLALELARKGGDSEQELRIACSLGDLYLKGYDLTRSDKIFNEALNLALNRNAPHHIWRAYNGLARLSERRSDIKQAEKLYRLAIEQIENLRVRFSAREEMAFFFHDKAETYQRLTTVLMKLEKRAASKGDLKAAKEYAVEAFQTSERARARSLLDSLSQTTRTLDQEIPSDMKAERWKILARISELELQQSKATVEKPVDVSKIKSVEHDLKQATEELREWQNRLRLRDPRLANLRFPEPLTVEQAQQMLKGN